MSGLFAVSMRLIRRWYSKDCVDNCFVTNGVLVLLVVAV